jgi:hypothetical protein
MPNSIPNLKQVVTRDMVRTIGSGSYAADYTPWSRIAELLNEHAPGWLPELVPGPDGQILHRAPKGGYLMVRFRNVDTGAETPAYVQAVQDNRHKAIPYEQIDARDVSDTSRRGFVLAAAAVFNLGIQLWTRDQLEDGYSRAIENSEVAPVAVPTQQGQPPVKTAKPAGSPKASAAKKTEVTKEQFLEASLAKGLTTHAAEALAAKLNGNFTGGIDRLNEKDAEWVKTFNEASDPKNSAEKW